MKKQEKKTVSLTTRVIAGGLAFVMLLAVVLGVVVYFL